MRHPSSGWPQARREDEAGESARPGQYALFCTNKFMENIPKQLFGFAMKLLVLFGRRVWCVVAWRQ